MNYRMKTLGKLSIQFNNISDLLRELKEDP